MRKKINKIFTDLVQYYKNIENVEETINEELQTKPACVHMSERVNEYEKIHILLLFLATSPGEIPVCFLKVLQK